MEFTAVILVAALVKKIVDLLVFLTAKDWVAVVKQLIAWTAGASSLWLVANTPWGKDFSVGDQHLGSLGVVALIVAGLLVGSGGSVLYDYNKAIYDKAFGNRRYGEPDSGVLARR